jgi:RING finger protein 113A
MHDRTDYKSGWQIDKEWEEARKNQQDDDPDKFLVKDIIAEESDSDDDLPFACLICRNDFKDPIMTKCKHYFCESVLQLLISSVP